MTPQDIDLSRAAWRKSSRSGGNGGQCVEVAQNLPGIVAIRDSKNPDGPKLIVTPREGRRFVKNVKDGQAEVI